MITGIGVVITEIGHRVYLHAERRKPGVTLDLLHFEYLEQHPDGYRYTRFCDIYRRWLTRRGLSMRQVHRAGEKCFVDYAGQKPRLIDPATGEVLEVELFVAVLGALNYTYAGATRTQQVPDQWSWRDDGRRRRKAPTQLQCLTHSALGSDGNPHQTAALCCMC